MRRNGAGRRRSQSRPLLQSWPTLRYQYRQTTSTVLRYQYRQTTSAVLRYQCTGARELLSSWGQTFYRIKVTKRYACVVSNRHYHLSFYSTLGRYIVVEIKKMLKNEKKCCHLFTFLYPVLRNGNFLQSLPCVCQNNLPPPEYRYPVFL